VTNSPDVKDLLFLHTKYLDNNATFGHSYRKTVVLL